MQGECHVCGKSGYVERHHILGGKNRKKCDRYPLLKIPLCPDCHRGTNGVHGKNGHELNLKFKKTAQILFETHYGTREEFIKLFGRNYLE
jgi:hypothetical protein